MIKVRQIFNSPVTSNCFVLYDKTVNDDCIVVDPGSKSDEALFDFFEVENLRPYYVILTHEHFDHCWGVNELVKRFQIPIVCSELCAEAIKYEKRNCSVFYDNKESFTINSETISVESLGGILHFSGVDIYFYSTPGHTEASICFEIGKFFFTGDTLIKDTRTVTKLMTGSKVGLQKSLDFIKNRQGKQLMVCPGHGEVFELDGYDLKKAIL